MYYFLLIAIMVCSGLFVFFTDKYLEFRRVKELHKSNVAFNIGMICGIAAVLMVLVLMFVGE